MQLVVINPQKSGGGGYESGHIRIHNGTIANIPEEWVLCDGTNGTPPMVDRAVVGAGGAYQPNQVFGSDSRQIQSATLAVSQMASHDHEDNEGDSASAGSYGRTSSARHYHRKTGATGGNAPHNHGAVDVRQKSVAVIWIMKL